MNKCSKSNYTSHQKWFSLEPVQGLISEEYIFVSFDITKYKADGCDKKIERSASSPIWVSNILFIHIESKHLTIRSIYEFVLRCRMNFFKANSSSLLRILREETSS